MSFVTECRYHSITISDHCPVQLDMSFPNSSVPQRSWQLDSLLLTQPSFVKFISEQIDFFLLVNTTPGMSYATIWESLKAYLRGQIISYATHKKRERNKRIKELNQEILNIDNQLANNSTPELFKGRLLLQTEFDNLSIRQTERMMLKTRQTYYEHGERAGKLLCHQLKQTVAQNAIPEIRVSSDSTSSHPQTINDRFKAYYTELYKSQASANATDIQDFLEGLTLPQVATEDKVKLDAPIAAEEITQAIGSMPVRQRR